MIHKTLRWVGSVTKLWREKGAHVSQMQDIARRKNPIFLAY